jgi:hypothetical protein
LPALDGQLFPDEAVRRRVHVAKAKARQRALYAIDDQTNEVYAAFSFHLDETETCPVMVTALAIREDGDEKTLSLASAGWLLACLFEVSRQDGRIGVATILEQTENDANYVAIGFAPVAPPATVRLQRNQRFFAAASVSVLT